MLKSIWKTGTRAPEHRTYEYIHRSLEVLSSIQGVHWKLMSVQRVKKFFKASGCDGVVYSTTKPVLNFNQLPSSNRLKCSIASILPAQQLPMQQKSEN